MSYMKWLISGFFYQPTTIHPSKWTNNNWCGHSVICLDSGQYSGHSWICLDNTVDILEYAWTIHLTLCLLVKLSQWGNFIQTLFNILQICLVCLVKWTTGIEFQLKACIKSRWPGHTEHLATGFEGSNTEAGEIMMGFYSAMYAYGGW